MKLIGTDHGDPKGPERLRKLLDHLAPQRISVEAPASLGRCLYSAFSSHLRSCYTEEFTRASLPPGFRSYALKQLASYSFEVPIVLNYAQSHCFPVAFVDLPLSRMVLDPAVVSPHLSNPLRKFLEYLQNQDAPVPLFELPLSAILVLFMTLFMKPDVSEGHLSHYIKSSEHFVRDTLGLSFSSGMEVILQSHQDLIDRGYQYLRSGMHPKDPLLDELLKDSAHADMPFEPSKRENFMASQIKTFKPDVHVGGAAHIFTARDDPVPLHKLLGDLVEERYLLIDADAL